MHTSPLSAALDERYVSPHHRRRVLYRRTAVPEEVLPCEGGRCEERQRAQTKQPRCKAEDPQLDADRGPPTQDPGSMIVDDDSR